MTIYAHDVQMFPKDYTVTVEVDGIRLHWNITLRNDRTGEVQRVSISPEEPMLAFFVAIWEQANRYDETSIENLQMHYMQRIWEKDSRIKELEKQLAEKEAIKEEEYAYVEGWDEF